MNNTKRILWLSFLIMFSFSLAISQEALFDEEEKQEDSNCVPEDLSVVYDQYANADDAENMVRQWYSFGSEHHKNKNYDKALPYLWKVFVNDSSKRGNLAIGKIAEIYFTQQKIDSTLLACYKGLAKFPDQQKLHYYAGFIQKELGKALCAIPHYESLVENNPDSKSYLVELAFLYYKAQDERCIEMQQRVVALDDSDTGSKETLATYMSSFGQSPIKLYRETCQSSPDNLDACRSYAKLALEEGLYQESVDTYTKVIAKQPTAQDYQRRATAYENLSQFSSAISDLNEWLKLDPDNPDIMLLIAVNYSNAKNFSTANNWINSALRKKSGYGKAYIIRGEMYENMVLYCQNQRDNNKPKLEDKIVYEKAIQVYEQALSDVAFKSDARTKINNLKPFVRTKEEVFMEPGAKVTSSCYSFLVD